MRAIMMGVAKTSSPPERRAFAVRSLVTVQLALPFIPSSSDIVLPPDMYTFFSR